MIRVEQLHKRFVQGRGRKARAIEAVCGVTLCAADGRITAVLGPNGAGKTTTLRMLATLISPTAGEATVAGADLRREPGLVRQRIGYVPGGVGGFGRAYFEVPNLPATPAYRVSVWDYTWFQSNGDGKM